MKHKKRTKKNNNETFSKIYIKNMNNKIHKLLENNVKKYNFNYQNDILIHLKYKKQNNKTIKQ